MQNVGASVRDTAALYSVRRAFHHWRHNEFDCARCETYIEKLVDAIDGLLARAEHDQQAWDDALGEVNWLICALGGFALVGGDESFYRFVDQQRAYLVANGVLS